MNLKCRVRTFEYFNILRSGLIVCKLFLCLSRSDYLLTSPLHLPSADKGPAHLAPSCLAFFPALWRQPRRRPFHTFPLAGFILWAPGWLAPSEARASPYAVAVAWPSPQGPQWRKCPLPSCPLLRHRYISAANA